MSIKAYKSELKNAHGERYAESIVCSKNSWFYCLLHWNRYVIKGKLDLKVLVLECILLFFAVNVLHYEAQGTFSNDAAPSHF